MGETNEAGEQLALRLPQPHARTFTIFFNEYDPCGL